MSTAGRGTLRPDPIVAIKGGGEMASAAAWRLHRANMGRIYLMDLPQPLSVRRGVVFCEALYDGEKTVEGVMAVEARNVDQIRAAWQEHRIPVLVDPHWRTMENLPADVVVDAILAKRNLGTRINEAPLVIALGPGFVAGVDAHVVIETNRGHNLGRVISQGSAEPNTGVPAEVDGHALARVVRAPADGVFQAVRAIGDQVQSGDILGHVDGQPVHIALAGLVRGLIRSGTRVNQGLKLGDIESRGDIAYCHTISDKARAIAGSVLESILHELTRVDHGHADPARKP